MNPQFDEDYYLETWWDVAQAVKNDHFSSGYEHWKNFGRQEGRIYRHLGDEHPRGRVKPYGTYYLEDISLMLKTDFPEFRHRGYGVRCCMEQKTRDKIRDSIAHIQNGVIAEVGVFGGATLLDLAEDGRANKNRLIGIDPWEKSSMVESIEDPVKRQEMANFFRQMRWNLQYIQADLGYDHIELIQESAHLAAQRLDDNSLDFLMIDGDHEEKAVEQDLRDFWPKVRPGGIVWGDDYDWPGVRAAAKRFAQEKNATLEVWNVQFNLRKS